MKITQSKQDCDITFRFVGKAKGLIHLVEIEYSRSLRFWFGVIEIALDDMPHKHPSYDSDLTVHLADERNGKAQVLQSVQTSEHLELAVVGICAAYLK